MADMQAAAAQPPTPTTHTIHVEAPMHLSARPAQGFNGDAKGALNGKGRVDNKIARQRAQKRSQWVVYFLENQIQIALTLISTLVATHLFYPAGGGWTGKFLALSYHDAATDTYSLGADDIYFVAGWIVMFTAVRAVCIEWVMRPVAAWLGVPRKTHVRFAEQGWLVVYCGVFWGLGMYLWYNSAYWPINSNGLWTNHMWTVWPANDMSHTFKWYYLVQFSFWLQQIVVVNIEERRRDYGQMLTHHIITCTLIFITYIYRYTRVANVILCLTDAVDIIFPAAKLLKYTKHETACNIGFGIFVVVWFFTRHVIFVYVWYTIFRDIPGPDNMLFGCYSGKTSEILPMESWPDYGRHLLWPFEDAEGTLCLNPQVKWIFLSMLFALQVLWIGWFGMIIRVIVNIIRGGTAHDNRSDEEGDDEDGIEDMDADSLSSQSPDQELGGLSITDVSTCVGSTSQVVSPRPPTDPRKRSRGNGGGGWGIRLDNAAQAKEILNRIGCERKTT